MPRCTKFRHRVQFLRNQTPDFCRLLLFFHFRKRLPIIVPRKSWLDSIVKGCCCWSRWYDQKRPAQHGLCSSSCRGLVWSSCRCYQAAFPATDEGPFQPFVLSSFLSSSREKKTKFGTKTRKTPSSSPSNSPHLLLSNSRADSLGCQPSARLTRFASSTSGIFPSNERVRLAISLNEFLCNHG